VTGGQRQLVEVEVEVEVEWLRGCVVAWLSGRVGFGCWVGGAGLP
jgi:hypothetical protein